MSQGFCTAYTPTPESVKLSELRAKTDQQLQGFVHSRLDVGLVFAVLAEVEQSAGDRAYAERSFGRAEQALAEVQRLVPVLNEKHRRGVDLKINELRETLDRLGRIHEFPRTQTRAALWTLYRWRTCPSIRKTNARASDLPWCVK